MTREQQPALTLFALGLLALGALSVLYRDFAYDWQPIPASFPARIALAVAGGLFLIAIALGLLFRPTVTIATRILFPTLIAWLSLKIPAILAAPQIEGVWIGVGELAMLLAGGWILFARLSALDSHSLFRHITGARGIRLAQILFSLAILPVGLGHLFYPSITATLIPAWMPFRLPLAYLTGYAQILCALAILLRIWPRLAALAETAMLTLFAFLVWGPDTWFAATPKLAGTPPGPRFPITAFLITWIVAAASLLIANNSAPAACKPTPQDPNHFEILPLKIPIPSRP